MTSRVALALCLLLSLICPSLASRPSESGGESVQQNSGAADTAADPAAANSEDQNAGDTAGQAESGDDKTPPIDVHRHRPGACPEGPPCKGDD